MNDGLNTRSIVATVAMALAVQALTAMALAVPPVLAPVAAADFGIAPAGVGNWVGFAYMVEMFAGPVSGALVGRHGPVRVLQIAVACVALGLAVGATAHAVLLIPCGVLLGVAHGLVNPASSAILVTAAPARLRSIVFSIKQTGVPVGAAITGMLVPALLLQANWQSAVLILAAGSAAVALVTVPFRRTYDHDRDKKTDQRLHLSRFAAPIAEVWKNRRILELALTSAVFSSVQMSFGTYLVSFLKLGLGYSLVAAGLVFSAAQVAGVVGRILWGAFADQFLAPRTILAILGSTMALCGLAAATFTASWPFAAVLAVCVLYGATAVGWNGVFLAEVARLAPEGRVAFITGGTQFYTFGGVLVGPPVFGAMVSATGSYAAGFVLVAVLPMAVGIKLLISRYRAAGGRP